MAEQKKPVIDPTDEQNADVTRRPQGKRPAPDLPPEFGGQEGPEPTRYGDWEKNGRCTDF
ncbi:hypothetical protein J2T57_003071 [Natronocella acetinitrilica]|jgi:hypothetical protein|uniref:DUF1674 domain-containing protein n=1 Tax=Natronocella acetinitrilica TaxID=414046 RepID=A0AAE3G4Y5_9GAMM|nr:DUF1674 domain-containing protein [Natronocella acetinitrilica]MCP1675916.1 hypothetical protein [Natronocella acetinitrilica]